MRATINPASSRNGKMRLLESCAVAAGMIALAHGGPATAQVAGSGTVTTLPSGTTAGTGANPSTVNVNGPQSIIDWTPSNTPVGGVIDFLPAGNTLNFVGNTPDYTVLNRFVDGGGTSITDQIALNGTVNSYLGSTTGPRGGNIWFYNAGGILIGATGVINVGSLVLTSNAIDTSGGLFGPGNTIRFRGAAGTSAITVNGAINAANGNPGGSYVALVAPRVVQAGAVRVDGSAAYVAAEQADIRINSGLFDINVTVGAEGGNVITHTGTTTGPAHQDGDSDQSRIYMVAIPKNDAVTMLVSGAIGYDDAVSATEEDGAVRLSAGYNITNGERNLTPVNGVAANIVVNDTLFRSSTAAYASGTFTGEALQQLPASPSPLSSAGQIFVEGNGVFSGDAGTSLTIGAGQRGGATGNLTVRSDGAVGAAGNVAVNVTGGTLSTGNLLQITSLAQPAATTGDGVGGTASLTITGGAVTSRVIAVSATASAEIGTNGLAGTARGGNASISVRNAGSMLDAEAISVNASAFGPTNISVATGGDAHGGTATLTVADGASFRAANDVSIEANGTGGFGPVQSGNGTGGTARIEITGANTSFASPNTSLTAQGSGGGSLGPMDALNGGDGTGGRAELVIDADNSATVSLDILSLDAGGLGGDASNSENVTGGDARGGTATATVNGGVTLQTNQLTLSADAQGGNGVSPGGTTGRSGNARGGDVTLSASNESTVAADSRIDLSAVGADYTGENFGAGTGGNVTVSASAGGTISTNGRLAIDAMGGSLSSATAQSGGNGTGGNVDLLAEGGTIAAGIFDVDVTGSTVNAVGAGGTAQGGTIDLLARNGGEIRSTLDASNRFDASAATGVSAEGTAATGGTIQLIANAGRIDLGIEGELNANGTSGGALTAGANPTGTGGTILIQTASDPASEVLYGGLFATANGRTALTFEAPGVSPDTAGSGRGGTIRLDVQGGILSGGTIELSANGLGNGGSANGTGGTAIFTQTGGEVTIGDLTLDANGIGNTAAGVSGSGLGGTATIDLSGGTTTAADIIVRANGQGGRGSDGNDADSSNIVSGGLGGVGRGGGATIHIGGTAIVDASIIRAEAVGSGGAGGDFLYAGFGGVPGPTGNGGNGTGGTATVNVTGGTVAASEMIAHASGIGGNGGSSFYSSSGGGVTGIGVGGTGGTGQGGTATIALQTAIDAVPNAGSVARGIGGDGGVHNVGGAGGNGVGGTAQAIVTNFDAGELAMILDATGQGGHGADGRDGAGGNGGNGTGGTARMRADGPDASLTVLETNFFSEGVGGDGGAGRLGSGSFEPLAPSGGHGGNGQGGAIEIVADEGAVVTLGLASSDSVLLSSRGRGGAGGAGSDSAFDPEAQAGNGGNGGAGTGGTVRLVTHGGTITSNGENVAIDASGVSGESGVGGIGRNGGTGGADGLFADTRGGRVAIEALNGTSGTGRIALGPTNIGASGTQAGRIELRAEGNIDFAGLDASALGTAPPTNNDSDVAPAGIFAALNGGTITSQGDVTLRTDSSIGVYARSNGLFDVDGMLTINAGDQIDIRHDGREGTAPTIRASDGLFAMAIRSISGAPGSLLATDGTLSLTAEGPAATIAVDRLDAADVVIYASGAASVEHAEAANDFTVSAASFRTGPNSIVTGGDIVVTSPGAVDLGNSSAGGFVQVTGQSIAFDSITAGLNVSLSADGTAPGAEGISGGSIAAGGDISLFANSIALTGPVTGDGSLFAFGTGGAVSVSDARVDGTISVSSATDLSGTYIAGGNIFLNSDGDITASAQANGGYVDGNGVSADGNLFVIAAGDVALTDSAAARMFGVSAGGSASVDGGTAGEDMLVVAGTTASLNDFSAGDDITIRVPGDIAATNVRATGTGADTHILGLFSGSGSPTFTIGVGEGTDGINGADIVMASTAGAIDAAALSAGDDILLSAAGNIALNGATTLGLGTTGGDSSIRTQGGATTLAGLDAFSDIAVDAAGLANLAGTVAAGRNATINAQDVTLAALTDPGGNAVPTLSANGNVVVASATGITGGALRAGGDMTLTAGAAIAVTGITGNSLAISGATGITADRIRSNGFDFDDTVSLDSSNGDIRIGDLSASAPIDASANAIRIESGGSLRFTTLTTDVGDAYVRGVFSVENGNVAGTADFATTTEAMNITNLTAANAILLNSTGEINLDTVTVAGNLDVTVLTPGISGASLGITGVVTGRSISLTSANIDIASTGRVGTAGTTQQVSIRNGNNGNQTFVGGTGTRNGYHIDTDELTRLYGTQIEIFAPEVQAASISSVGSAAPPDVIVDSFTMTGGAPNSNLGANGALTIRTPGKMRVVGNVELTGLTDANALNLDAGNALEIILGRGTVRLLGTSGAPGGQLNMASDDIIVATEAAIAAVGTATTIDAVNTRLGQNDGIALDEGALFARGIRAQVGGGFYVQNSGAGTDFGERRGLTFGAGGLTVVPTGQPRVVINGVHLGPNGQVTGLDVIPMLTVVQPSGAAGSLHPRSTLNGCFIANPTACTTVTIDTGTSFPVQDVIEEEAGADSEGEGNNLPTPLITMRDLDPLSGEPLVDDPVTGAGNDDLWTIPSE